MAPAALCFSALAGLLTFVSSSVAQPTQLDLPSLPEQSIQVPDVKGGAWGAPANMNDWSKPGLAVAPNQESVQYSLSAEKLRELLKGMEGGQAELRAIYGPVTLPTGEQRFLMFPNLAGGDIPPGFGRSGQGGVASALAPDLVGFINLTDGRYGFNVEMDGSTTQRTVEPNTFVTVACDTHCATGMKASYNTGSEVRSIDLQGGGVFAIDFSQGEWTITKKSNLTVTYSVQ
jgi:hypothetical protein